MYNKLFTKILDSSIWLETDATRIVWLTLIAAMDEQGFVQFASVANLAHRARVLEPAAEEAVRKLEAPDVNSSDPENEGRRIERVPGGWIILNAEKYRELVTRAISQEQTRIRVARHRAKKASCNAHVTACNGDVTRSNESVTPSEAVTETDTTNHATPFSLQDAWGTRDGRVGADKSPIDKLFEFWNENCHPLPRAVALTPKRRSTISTRLKDSFFAENYESAIRRMAASEFCRGNNANSWKADLDFFLKPDSVAKVLEGKYDSNGHARIETSPREI